MAIQELCFTNLSPISTAFLDEDYPLLAVLLGELHCIKHSEHRGILLVRSGTLMYLTRVGVFMALDFIKNIVWQKDLPRSIIHNVSKKILTA